MLPEFEDGAELFPLLDFIARTVAVIPHALGVRAGAVGLAFEQRRTAAAAGALDGFARRRLNGQHVIAIHFESRQAIRSAVLGDGRVPGRVVEWNLCGKLIVLAHEQH